jgi:hypothetical protein
MKDHNFQGANMTEVKDNKAPKAPQRPIMPSIGDMTGTSGILHSTDPFPEQNADLSTEKSAAGEMVGTGGLLHPKPSPLIPVPANEGISDPGAGIKNPLGTGEFLHPHDPFADRPKNNEHKSSFEEMAGTGGLLHPQDIFPGEKKPESVIQAAGGIEKMIGTGGLLQSNGSGAKTLENIVAVATGSGAGVAASQATAAIGHEGLSWIASELDKVVQATHLDDLAKMAQKYSGQLAESIVGHGEERSNSKDIPQSPENPAPKHERPPAAGSKPAAAR